MQPYHMCNPQFVQEPWKRYSQLFVDVFRCVAAVGTEAGSHILNGVIRVKEKGWFCAYQSGIPFCYSGFPILHMLQVLQFLCKIGNYGTSSFSLKRLIFSLERHFYVFCPENTILLGLLKVKGESFHLSTFHLYPPLRLRHLDCSPVLGELSRSD